MYEIIKSVIQNGTYILSDIFKKIDTLWVQGDLTDDQRNELIELARENADYTMELDVLQKLEELEGRIKKLENGETTPEPGPEEAPPEYVPGKWYYRDDKIAHKGEQYRCIAPEGVVCTWSPDEYPAYWELIS